MKNSRLSLFIGMVIAVALLGPNAGEAADLWKCSIPGSGPSCRSPQGGSSSPTCGIELTCTDKPVQLGYSDGVCFRASCPGIWALVHKRADQASLRSRYFTYRHYAFRGTWELKDQGAIESVNTPFRELFLVLPDDLIELKLRDPDANAAIEVTNLGYIKKGSVEELKKWLAYNVYLERPVFQSAESEAQRNQAGSPWYPGSSYGHAEIFLSPINYMGRLLGLPWF
ncbi:MAG: hypothetical protein ACLP5H_26705 [Desulfomonilaceae bacterium]